MRHHADMGHSLLLAIAPVSRDFRQVARVAWAERKRLYKVGQGQGRNVENMSGPSKPCAGCKKNTSLIFPFDHSLNACMTCTGPHGPKNLRTISLTECKEGLLLTPADLSPCAVLVTSHRTYHNIIRMYRWQEVIIIAFEKHGGPAGLNAALDRRSQQRRCRGASAREAREVVVSELVREFALDRRTDKRTIMEACCNQYIRNGKGGKRRVRARIERFLQFDRACPPATGNLKLLLDAYKEDYLDEGANCDLDAALVASELYDALDGCVNCLDEEEVACCLAGRVSVDVTVRCARARAAREKEVRTALASRGLQLRSDSRLCENYILFGDGLINRVVDTMEEMQFFFAHTAYPREILRTSSEEAKKRALDQWVADGGPAGDPELPVSLVRTIDKRMWRQVRRDTAFG
jgi:hypothetical protein